MIPNQVLLFCFFSFSFSLVFGGTFERLSDCVDKSFPNNCYWEDEDHYSCHKISTKPIDCRLGFFESLNGGHQDNCLCVSDCDFESEVLANQVSKCGISKLNGVDHEISSQIAVNVIGAVGGNIPVIGAFFDVGFAAWSPVNIVTSPFQLSDDIRDEINKAIIELTECIDEKIASALVLETIDDAQDKLRAITRQFSDTVDATGDTQINRIFNTFFDFTSVIVEIFGDSSVTMMSGNVAEFEGLLAVYQAIYPLYSIVSAERLNYLKNHLISPSNFNNAFDIVMRNFEILEKWIDEAHGAISDPHRVFINEQCRNKNAMYLELNAWDSDFETIYISNLKENMNAMQQINDAPYPEIFDATTEIFSNVRAFWFPRTIGIMLNHGVNVPSYFFNDGFETALYSTCLNNEATSFAAPLMRERNTFSLIATDYDENDFELSPVNGKTMGWQWMVWVNFRDIDSSNSGATDFFIYSNIVTYMSNDNLVPQCNANDCDYSRNADCQICIKNAPVYEYGNLQYEHPQYHNKILNPLSYKLIASWKRVDSVSEFVTGVSGVSESELTFGFATNAMNFFNDNNNEMAFGNVNIVKNEVKAITSVLLHVGVLEKKYAPNEAVPRNSDPCGFISDYYNLAPFVNPTLYQYVVSFTAPAPSPASSESTDKSFEVYTGDWVCVEEGMTPPQCPLGFTVGVTSHKIYYQNCIPYQA